MFMKLRNYKKIIFPVMLLGLLFFTFSFFYNKEEAISAVEQWDWECQEEEIGAFGQYLGGGEIPIGEAMDGTYAMATAIIWNYDQMLPAGGQVVAAANAVYELPLPDECQAENCNTDCWMNYSENYWGECDAVTVTEQFCDPNPDNCLYQECTANCADVTISRTGLNPPGCPPEALPGSCVCGSWLCTWEEKGDFCEYGNTCNPANPTDPTCFKISNDPETWVWGDDECSDFGVCAISSCGPEMCIFFPPAPSDECCWTDVVTGETCWYGPGIGACDCGPVGSCDPAIDPTCFNIGTETQCWGDNECFDKSFGGACEEKYVRDFDCGISSCTGNACPIDAIVELGDQRAIIYIRSLQIANYAAAINTEVQKAPGLRAMLEKARIGLAACTTPASGYEPTEEVQLVETLVSCDEAKWLRMLSDDQEECYLTNFFCCEPIEK
ncbi:hypothetical protein LCGC14_0160840 [marine sediment metagenome]|uniref:Uncharacterized protein n=1 Tax=marine sediment metagenome TaxID=412755 RepID=A0A0F9XDL3_9ZZZZ